MNRNRPTPLRFLLASFGDSLPSLAAGAGFSILAIASNAGLLSVSAGLIAAALLMPSIADLQVAIVGVRFFGLLRGGFRYLERLAAHTGAFQFASRARSRMLAVFERAPGLWFRSFASGDLLSRFAGDADLLQEFPLRAALPLSSFGLLTAISLWIVSRAVPLAVPVLFGWLGLLALACLLFGRALIRSCPPPSRAALGGNVLAAVQSLPEQILLDGGRTAQRTVARAESLAETGLAAHRRAASTAQSAFALLHGILLVLCVAAVARGGDAVATLVTAGFALALQECLMLAPAAFVALGESLGAARRIQEVIAAPVAHESVMAAVTAAPAFDPSAPAVEFEGVTFSYPGALLPALDGACFRIPAGARAALIGPSGSGKSTILHILLRLVAGYRGTVRLSGVPLDSIAPEDSRARMDSMLAQPGWLHASLRENLAFGGEPAAEDRIREVLDALRLSTRFPSGSWDAPLGGFIQTASAGEMRRIALARALLQPAPLLLLDEPAENLDSETGAAVWDAVAAFAAGRTLLCVTHSARGLARCDYLVRLNEGRTLEERAVDPGSAGLPG